MRFVLMAAGFVVALFSVTPSVPVRAAERCGFDDGETIDLTGTVADRGNKRAAWYGYSIESVSLAKCPEAVVRVMVDPAAVPAACENGKAVKGSGTIRSLQDTRRNGSLSTFGVEFYLVQANGEVTCE